MNDLSAREKQTLAEAERIAALCKGRDAYETALKLHDYFAEKVVYTIDDSKDDDDTAIGALNALEEAGLNGISIIGFDGNPSALERIYSGGITATIAQQPALIGYMSVITAVSALRGEEVEENVTVDTVIIDAGNCMDYLPE